MHIYNKIKWIIIIKKKILKKFLNYNKTDWKVKNIKFLEYLVIFFIFFLMKVLYYIILYDFYENIFFQKSY